MGKRQGRWREGSVKRERLLRLNQFNASDFHAFGGGGALLADAADVRDLVEDLLAGDELTKGRIFIIKEGGVAVADEELAAGAVRVARARHGEHALHVGAVVELGLDHVAGSAGAGGAAGADLGVGATALDHEALDDSVKGRTVIKSFTGEF